MLDDEDRTDEPPNTSPPDESQDRPPRRARQRAASPPAPDAPPAPREQTFPVSRLLEDAAITGHSRHVLVGAFTDAEIDIEASVNRAAAVLDGDDTPDEVEMTREQVDGLVEAFVTRPVKTEED